VVTVRQGEVWWAETVDKRRPVLVVTRDAALPVLTWVVVAPLTRTIRGIPTEIPFGPEEGLETECVASFDNLDVTDRSLLVERIAPPSAGSRGRICRALSALADC
jgi:mRNA interferase MazF